MEDMVGYSHMQSKNVFLLLALSGSVLMVMLVSTLLFIPSTSSLRSDITTHRWIVDVVGKTPQQTQPQELPEDNRDTAKILGTIQQYVVNNDPDAAKKLYEELYMTRKTKEPGISNVEK